MKRRNKWLLAACGALALVFVADYAASRIVRSHRVQKALTARLAAAFGETYAAYRAHVRRWL